MKVQSRAVIRGPDLVLDPGQVAEISEALAQPLLLCGAVVAVSAPEAAVVEPAERAVQSEARKPEPKEARPPEDDLDPWPPNKRIKKSPKEYLAAAPDGKYADLARRHVGE